GLGWIFQQPIARVDDGQWSFEAGRELGDVGVETGVVADRGLVQSNHQQVVALLGLLGERLGRRGLVGDHSDVELLVILLILGLALVHLLGRSLQKLGRRFGALLGLFGGFLLG